MSFKSKMRQDALLSILPKHPKKITASELVKELNAAGYRVSLRQVQRDLKCLEEKLDDVLCDRRERLFGWYRK